MTGNMKLTDKIETAARARPRVRKAERRCYELAWRTLFNLPDPTGWVLVHGEGTGRSGRIGHAWLEHGDTFFDPVAGGGMALERCERMHRIVAHARYSLKQAAEAVISTGHYGPWHEDLP